MPDERLLLALIIRGVLVTLAAANSWLALGQYREFRDARGLRGFVSSLTMLFGALALAGSSSVIREAIEVAAGVLRWVTTIGVAGFVIGILFSVYTWRYDRAEQRRRRAALPHQAHYRGSGDH